MPRGVYRRDIEHSMNIRFGMTKAWTKNPDKGKPRPDYVKEALSRSVKATLARKKKNSQGLVKR